MITFQPIKNDKGQISDFRLLESEWKIILLELGALFREEMKEGCNKSSLFIARESFASLTNFSKGRI